MFVSGGFDDPLSRHVRFLQEGARMGPLHVVLWRDEDLRAATGRPPRLALPERRYFLESLTFVDRVSVLPAGQPTDTLPAGSAAAGDIWAASAAIDGPGFPDPDDGRAWCESRGVRCVHIAPAALEGFPRGPGAAVARPPRGTPLVLATGSFDWLHTGHIRFFEEAAALGDLAVVVGHDANIRLLKGEGHPRFGQEERLYLVSAVRTVSLALLSTGSGWLDAEPEIERLRPDRYVVNQDGDKPEKRAYCREHGIEYVVLTRAPRPGLPRRSSTELRGF